MKRLTIVRHAKSSWKDSDTPDFDRPLNKRGEHDAPMMGKRLARRQVAPDLLICSPARRAIDTASTIANEIGFPVADIAVNERIYEATTGTLLDLVQHFEDSYEDVMLFGHNPALTELCNALTEHTIDNLPTGGVYCVDFAIETWGDLTSGEGNLVFFDYPKNVDENEYEA